MHTLRCVGIKKKMRCNNCGLQISVPPNAHTIQCPLCQNLIRVKPNNEPFGQAHNPICHATSRLKDMFHTASNNINNMIDSHSGSGASGFGYYPKPVSLVPVSAHGRKRAVLCGVSYYGQHKHRLKGPVNDIKCMRHFLVQKLGFPNDAVLFLSEEESNPYLIPTKFNIRKALQWLVQGCQSGDSLVFHFSGHGSQQLDYNRDEIDGYDEMLWPVDHQTEGAIVDDEINATIVRPLPRGAKLHAIIDACHSGTILDLPFVCRMDSNGYYLWEDHGGMSAVCKNTNGGFAVSISACDDHQVSVDTTALTGNIATGAMTYSFLQAVQNEPGLTYGRLITAMHRTIRDTKTGFLPNGPVSSLVKKVLMPKLSQEAQLSSSEKFDIYSRQFVL